MNQLELAEVARELTSCPRCESVPGDPCWTRSGRRVRHGVHADRLWPIMDVWNDGYNEAERETLRYLVAQDLFTVDQLPTWMQKVVG